MYRSPHLRTFLSEEFVGQVQLLKPCLNTSQHEQPWRSICIYSALTTTIYLTRFGLTNMSVFAHANSVFSSCKASMFLFFFVVCHVAFGCSTLTLAGSAGFSVLFFHKVPLGASSCLTNTGWPSSQWRLAAVYFNVLLSASACKQRRLFLSFRVNVLSGW